MDIRGNSKIIFAFKGLHLPTKTKIPNCLVIFWLNSLLALTILLRLHVPVLHFFWMQSCCYHSRRVAFLCCIWNRWEPQRKTCRLTSHMTWTRYILEQHNWGQAEPMARGVVPTVRHYRWTEEKIIWAKYQYSQLKLGL